MQRPYQLEKNKIVLFAILILIIIVGVVIYFKKPKEQPPQITPTPSPTVKINNRESFGLAATILSVDTANKFIIVKPDKGGNDIKVILSGNTRIEKIKPPALDPKNPSKIIALEILSVKITDFKKDDSVFIKSSQNIIGKTEINNIDYIQIFLK